MCIWKLILVSLYRMAVNIGGGTLFQQPVAEILACTKKAGATLLAMGEERRDIS